VTAQKPLELRRDVHAVAMGVARCSFVRDNFCDRILYGLADPGGVLRVPEKGGLNQSCTIELVPGVGLCIA
jgi:hypothetical protein